MLREIFESEVTEKEVIDLFADEVRAKKMVDMINSLLSEFETRHEGSDVPEMDIWMGPHDYMALRNCIGGSVKYNHYWKEAHTRETISLGVFGRFGNVHPVKVKRELDEVEIRARQTYPEKSPKGA